MQRITILFVLSVYGFVSLVSADEASKTAKVQELLTAAKIDQMQEQMLSMMANQMKSGTLQQMLGTPALTPDQQKLANEFQDKVLQLVSQMISWEELKPTYVKLYAETFTEDEIVGMLAFYKSPAGLAMVSKTPQLMTQANQIVQQRMLAIQPRMQALMKEYKDKIKAQASQQ